MVGGVVVRVDGGVFVQVVEIAFGRFGKIDFDSFCRGKDRFSFCVCVCVCAHVNRQFVCSNTPEICVLTN